jgi:hypothetical protein
MNLDNWLDQWHEVKEPDREPEAFEDDLAVDVWQDGVDRHRAEFRDLEEVEHAKGKGQV